jgi:hypothetical protein
MKRTRILAAAAAFLVLASSCSTLIDLAMKVTGTDKAIAKSVSSLAESSYAMQFSSVYLSSVMVGGYASDEGYAAGQGTSWRIVDKSPSKSETMTVERALLAERADGSKWWSLSYASGGTSVYYEYLAGKDADVLEFKYKDQDSGEIRTYVEPTKQAEASPSPSAAPATRSTLESLKASSSGVESVSVPAGDYEADKVHSDYTDGESGKTSSYDWWIASGVPGGLVKYSMSNGDAGESITGELLAVKGGYAPKYGPLT